MYVRFSVSTISEQKVKNGNQTVFGPGPGFMASNNRCVNNAHTHTCKRTVPLTSILAILGLFPSIGELEDGEGGFVIPVGTRFANNEKTVLSI